MRYVISDTHIGHENIIDYCDRPFDSVNEMDSEIIRRWNQTVGEDDTVLFLGDLVEDDHYLTGEELLDNLNGNILFVRGNHDGWLSQNAGVNVVESCTIGHGRYRFYCEHRPAGFSSWEIHGHKHNNDMRDYPFINYEKKRINVSAELLDYKPLRMDDLVYMLDQRERYEYAERNFDYQ